MDRLKQLLTEEAEEELSSTQDITGEEINLVENLRYLQELKMNSCKKLTAKGFARMLHYCFNIKKLNISYINITG